MPSNDSILVSAKNLEYAYPGHDPVLQIKELTLKAGEHVFLHGPSGTGKTTLLGLLSGVLIAGSGVLEILGKELCSLSPAERDHFRGHNIGYIFQVFNLIPYLTVAENILLPLRFRSNDVAKEASGKLSHLAEQLNILQLLQKKASDISVGQAQRVAAARSLIAAPPIVLADEPTSSLDSDNREDFIKTLFNTTKETGSTVIFVSHDHSLSSLFPKNLELADINEASHR